jgi:putative transposase
MSRTMRARSSTGIYHIILRGVNKQNIFEEDLDRKKFVDAIKYYRSISQYRIYGYCLMDNHIHLLIRETEENISDIIKRISSSYVLWYNKKYNRCGHLFQERFRSEKVESNEYFLTALRYIHQNPYKAGMTHDFTKYYWSSYKNYVGSADYIDIDYTLELLSENKFDSNEFI